MGWTSGSALMTDIINAFEMNCESVDEDEAVDFFRDIITSFENSDCDTLAECLDISDAFDLAYGELHPDHFEDEDE